MEKIKKEKEKRGRNEKIEKIFIGWFADVYKGLDNFEIRERRENKKASSLRKQEKTNQLQKGSQHSEN